MKRIAPARNLMYGLIFAAALFFAPVSCSPHRPAKTNGGAAAVGLPYVINLEGIHKNKDAFPLSGVAESLRYVPLETTDDVLLKGVYHVALLDNSLFVGDYNNLYRFDMSGKFLGKTGTRGEGPTDHLRISAVVADKASHTLYLFTRAKILQYDSKGALLKVVSTKDSQPDVYDGGMISGDRFLMYIGTQYTSIHDTAAVYSFVEMDTLGRVHRKIERDDPILAEYPGMVATTGLMYTYDGRVHFLDYGADTLYRYSASGGKEPYAVCKLGAMKCPVTVPGSKQEEDALLSKLRIDRVTEDDRLIYLRLAWGLGDRPLYAVFDKTTGETKGLGPDGMTNDRDGGLPFFPQYTDSDGLKIGWKYAADFKESVLSGDPALSTSRYGDRLEALLRLASSINEDDNPVLILAR